MKNRTEFQTERGGELGGRAEGEIGVVVENFADIRGGHFHSAGEFRLRDVELDHSVDDTVDKTGGKRVGLGRSIHFDRSDGTSLPPVIGES